MEVMGSRNMHAIGCREARWRLLFPWLVLLASGCCMLPLPPGEVTPPPALPAPALDPVAVANRALTTLLIRSPLASNRPARVAFDASGVAADEALARAMMILRAKLTAERNVRLVDSTGEPDYRLATAIVSDPARRFELTMTDTDGKVVCLYRHDLPPPEPAVIPDTTRP